LGYKIGIACLFPAILTVVPQFDMFISHNPDFFGTLNLAILTL